MMDGYHTPVDVRAAPKMAPDASTEGNGCAIAID